MSGTVPERIVRLQLVYRSSFIQHYAIVCGATTSRCLMKAIYLEHAVCVYDGVISTTC